ncbi:MAG: alanyl-tRNA editing protein [Candidatus Bathyarchaeia archaeon]
MTILIFRDDPYQREFDATILRAEDKFIVLDRTCFFPRGGGQVGDTGVLSGSRVLDTIREGDEVHHLLEDTSQFNIGQSVHGVIDWNRRYRIMRLHSASHLVYYIMRVVFGEGCKPTSSGLLDDLKDRSDYLFDVPLDRVKLAEVEERVNRHIADGLPITHRQESGEGRLIWKVASFPAMECGGTHVRNTSEIGQISLKRGSKPGRGKERIELTLVH